MNDELVADLRRAIQMRQQKDDELAAALNDLTEAQAALRRTKEARRVQSARRIVNVIRDQREKSVAHLRSVENQLESGLSGFPLFDLTKQEGRAEAG